jgi:endonuclease-3
LLSAQCTDVRVNQVTPNLFGMAPGPKEMAGLDESQIEEVIRPCGLSKNKAKAIKRLSEILVEQHGGEVPASMDELEQLPGVGHKTASVVMIQAFNTPAFPVDTHIHRLAERWGLSDGKSVQKTEEDLKQLFPPQTWAKVHLQMIWFGRTHCTAKAHDPQKCPICGLI